MMKKARRSFSPQYKAMAVAMHREKGFSKTDGARRLGIQRSMVERWERQLYPDTSAEPQKGEVGSGRDDKDREIERLREQNRKLLEEKEVLKKATAFFAREQS